MPTRTIQIQTDTRVVSLHVCVAATRDLRLAGFQGATLEDIKRHLILFDFGSVQAGGPRFHMRHVLAPLDIAFAGADGRIFELIRMVPSPTARYGPSGVFQFALEAPAGYCSSQGIEVGARLLVPRRDLFASAAASGKLM